MGTESVKHTNEDSNQQTVRRVQYDPFVRGRFPVGVRTIHAFDATREREFPCEIWYPATSEFFGQDISPATCDYFSLPLSESPCSQMAVRDAAIQPGVFPLIIFSHHGGGPRRMATFLCTHLSSHGYVVAAMDHSEVVAVELARKHDETDEEKSSRIDAWIANRVPDVRFLLDQLLNGVVLDLELDIDLNQVGIVGHSFGGWTALAAAETDTRIGTVVALAPAGSTNPKPGIIPAKLKFNWNRDVPTLYLVAENDVSVPLAGMYDLFERTPATKQMVVLSRADHMHFMDSVETMHEIVRGMEFEGELAWLPKEMRPISELCSGEQAHLFVRGLTVCHMDAILKQKKEARQFLKSDIQAELATRGVDVFLHTP